MEIRIPKPKTSANPLMRAVPNQNKNTAEIIDEILASRIDGQARVNPVFTEL